MRYFITAFLLILGISVQAQFPVPKFGDVDINDLKMTSYDKDTTADALVLFDEGKTSFALNDERSFVFNFERHLRIKIFRKSAFDAANFTIRLYNRGKSKETLSSFRATTYNLVNGKIAKTKVDIDKTFDTQGKYYTEKKIAFPEVKEGSIIELSYLIQSDLLYNLRGWTFQYQYPALLSQYSIFIPEYFQYRKNAKGYLSFDISNEKQVKRTFVIHYSSELTPGMNGGRSSAENYNLDAEVSETVMAIKNIPAFKPEPDIDCMDNYIQSISFELMNTHLPGQAWQTFTPTWDEVNNKMNTDEDFGVLLRTSRFMADTVAAVCSKASSQMDKARMIYSFVQSRMKWNGSHGLWAVNGLKKPFSERTGNSAEINLLLTLMLQNAGLKASPVIISTRTNGMTLGVFPSISDFNSVISDVEIDGRTYLLDATSKSCPFGILPPDDINGTGRLVNEIKGGTVDLTSQARYQVAENFILDISPDGIIKGSLTELYDGYAGIVFRNAIKSEKTIDDYFRKIQENAKGLTITKYSIQDLDDINKAVSDSLNLELNEYIDIAGDKLLFYPLLFERTEKNRYSLEERKYPVNYNYPIERRYVFTYTIPDGYAIESLPKSILIRLPDNSATFTYSLQSIGNKINVTCIQTITKVIYLPAEYRNLKSFYDQIVSKSAEQIILRKAS